MVQGTGVLLAEVFFWASIVLALLARSWWPLLLFPIGWAGWIAGVGQWAALLPTDEPAVVASRRSGYRFLLVLAMLMAIGYAFFGDH